MTKDAQGFLATCFIIIVGVVAVIGAYALQVPARGYSQEDIDNIKISIRENCAKKGLVCQVTMIKESPKKLFGFVTVKVPLLGEISKPCESIWGSKYWWRCGSLGDDETHE